MPTANITLQRQNNYYSQTDITVDANYSSLDGQNTINIYAMYKKTTDSTYSTAVILQDNVTATLNLDNLYEWDVQVVLTDRLGTTTYNLTVGKGMPIIYFDRLKRSVGINCFPNYDSSLEVNGDLYREKNMITATASDVTITTNGDSKFTNIIYNSVLASLGNKLSLNTSTGVITIGSGINYVKVSCGCYIIMNSTGTYHRLVLLKNGTQYGKTSQTKGSYSQAVYGTLCISNVLIPVTEGDTISAQTFCRLTGTYTVGEIYISVETV